MKDKVLLFVNKDLHIGQKIDFEDYSKYAVPNLHGEYSFIPNSLTFGEISNKYKQNAVIIIKEKSVTHRINNLSHNLDVYIGEISENSVFKTSQSTIEEPKIRNPKIRNPKILLMLSMIFMELSMIFLQLAKLFYLFHYSQVIK